MADQPAGTARIRAGDADRERVVAALRTHHAEGRLDLDEFQTRVDAAYAAKYVDELPPLVADLPPESRPSEPAAAPTTARCPIRRGVSVPLIALLTMLLLVTTVGALAHGHPPFGLFWALAAIVWWRFLRGSRRRRAAARAG